MATDPMTKPVSISVGAGTSPQAALLSQAYWHNCLLENQAPATLTNGRFDRFENPFTGRTTWR